jgi:hypothetical protein
MHRFLLSSGGRNVNYLIRTKLGSDPTRPKARKSMLFA